MNKVQRQRFLQAKQYISDYLRRTTLSDFDLTKTGASAIIANAFINEIGVDEGIAITDEEQLGMFFIAELIDQMLDVQRGRNE